jgi:hypothetical protein
MDPIYPDLFGFEELDENTLEYFDPFVRFIAASGEVDLEYPDPLPISDISISTINMSASTARNAAAYNTARASRPLSLMSLSQDVRKKIYAMVLGPPIEIAVRQKLGAPTYTMFLGLLNQVAIRIIRHGEDVQYSVDSPINLFLVSRKVHQEAASVLYGGTKFHLQTEWGIGYMTAQLGLNNCREIRKFTTYMRFVWNIPLTLRTVFPQLDTLDILPEQDWFDGPWFDFLHKKHSGNYKAAIDEAVRTSQKKAAFGLKELAEMSEHYSVVMILHFWNNANTTCTPIVVSVPMQQSFLRKANFS